MNDKRPGVVYVLCDPRNPKVPRYIGKTVSPIRGRLGSHITRASEFPKHPLSIWLNSIMDEGVLPTIYVLETCTADALQDRETAWIKFYRPLGSLTNLSDGWGLKGMKAVISEKNRAATAARNKRGWTPQMREKIMAWHKTRGKNKGSICKIAVVQ